MANPADAEFIEWDEDNEAELAAHRIAPTAVEEVFASSPKWAKNKSSGSGDHKMMGVDESGRRLTIVVAYDEARRSLRPITGWRPTPGELTRYFEA